MDYYGYLYDEIYGFKFVYNWGKVGKSKVMSRSEVEDLPDSKSNGDDTPLFVKCKSCNEFMDYDDGWFECERCGSRVKERTLFNQLDCENELDDSEWEDIYDD